jgi:16S rRNA (cytidine1402-2'-O)-methyltransferase
MADGASTSPAPPTAGAARGALLLVPNALDLGAAPQDLSEVLPLPVLRAAASLRHWLVEDAKSARAFLKRVQPVAPLVVPLQELEIAELPRSPKGRPPIARPSPWIATADSPWRRLLAPALAGHDMGLLSEAGLPAVADPGADAVAAAHALGLAVRPLPGPSSLLLALAASGLDGQSFAFVGYLPQEAAARRDRIRELEAQSRSLRQTQIFIETPYRNAALLAALIETLAPATLLAVSVGLTLPTGWCHSAAVADWRRRPGPLPRADAMPDRLPAVFLLQA